MALVQLLSSTKTSIKLHNTKTPQALNVYSDLVFDTLAASDTRPATVKLQHIFVRMFDILNNIVMYLKLKPCCHKTAEDVLKTIQNVRLVIGGIDDVVCISGNMILALSIIYPDVCTMDTVSQYCIINFRRMIPSIPLISLQYHEVRMNIEVDSYCCPHVLTQCLIDQARIPTDLHALVFKLSRFEHAICRPDISIDIQGVHLDMAERQQVLIAKKNLPLTQFQSCGKMLMPKQFSELRMFCTCRGILSQFLLVCSDERGQLYPALQTLELIVNGVSYGVWNSRTLLISDKIFHRLTFNENKPVYTYTFDSFSDRTHHSLLDTNRLTDVEWVVTYDVESLDAEDVYLDIYAVNHTISHYEGGIHCVEF